MIAALAEIFTTHRADVHLGIGDDAAVVASPDSRIVVCADVAVEGVHFKREWSALEEIGSKITAANLADVYAMGATPTYLLVTACLPRNIGKAELQSLARGIKAEADRAGAVVVGGDLSSGSALTLSVTALGTLLDSEQAITRSGARPGDLLIVSSLPGSSAAGLSALMMNMVDGVQDFMDLHRKPVVDYAAAQNFARSGVTSMIDISDGLLSEAHHISTASGVAIEIDSALIAASPHFAHLKAGADLISADVWDWILTGGEDHVFLATISGNAPSGALVIGSVKSGSGVSVLGIESRNSLGFTHFTE